MTSLLLLYHEIWALGVPFALQWTVTISPGSAMTSIWSMNTDGGTAEEKRFVNSSSGSGSGSSSGIYLFTIAKMAQLMQTPGGGLIYETDGDARRLA